MNIVHIGGENLNTAITSQEAIMKVCRSIVASKGLSSLNMRSVAKECDIALGTLYNYYADKEELVLATIESVWKDIFHMTAQCSKEYSFIECVNYIFDCIQNGTKEYPNFLTSHSITSIEKGKAKGMMEHYYAHMKARLLEALNNDPSLHSSSFFKNFSKTDFVDFVFDNILLLSIKGKTDCHELIKIIERVM